MMNNLEMLKELKTLLNRNLSQNRVDQVILFGSRATGKAGMYSDYDVLITLRDDYDWRLKHQISDICYDIDLKYDIILDSKVISKNEMKTLRGRQPFILDALEKGIQV